MQYITAAQAAEKWGVTVRRIQDLCRNNQIHGAVRWGRDWMIPNDAHRPEDRRRKAVVHTNHITAQLPRKNPAIVMSNIYNRPGSADAVAASLKDRPEAAALFRSHIAYCRGEIDDACRIADQLLEKPCSHDLQIGCGLTLAMCAIRKGDTALWNRAKKIIAQAPCHSTQDRCAVDFWLGAMLCEIRETNEFPLWFTRGSFDVLPGDSYPPARFYYLRLMHLMGLQYAQGHKEGGMDTALLQAFAHIAEPLVAQNHKEGALVSEIYCRLICACAYHDIGNDAMAIHHLDIAIALALPDKLYMLLAEYRRQMDFLMDERLQLADPAAVAVVRNLNKMFLEGWTVLHNSELGKHVSNELTTREREVAKHAAFGLSNKEIADRLHISINTVKQSLRTAMDKTGALRRSELAHYI